MKPNPSPTRIRFGSIEILEARIAPARVIPVGVPDSLPGSTPAKNVNYDTPGYFVDTVTGAAAHDAISLAAGSYSNPAFTAHPDESFYIKLNAGDLITTYVAGSQASPLLRVNSGQVVAFFEDLDHNNEVSSNELVSLSMGRGAAVTLQATLAGSIVGNLNASGTVDMNDLVSTQQVISGVSMGGFAVQGKILVGGNIANITAGSIAELYAGTAALGKSFTFFPKFSDGVTSGNVGTINFLSPAAGAVPGTTAPAIGQPGASIFNVAAEQVGIIQAGNGGVSGAGGVLSGVQILQETTSFTLLAGNGGAGDARHGNGGAGGGIGKLYIAGFTDSTPNDVVHITAGAGGAGTTGVGGNGGSISTLYVGATLQNNVPTFSRDFVADDFAIQAGAGGNGASGGVGGSIGIVRMVTNTPADTGLAGKGLAHEIVVQAGAGGNSTDTVAHGSHAGAGGSLANMVILDQALQPLPFALGDGATVAVLAGNAGTTANVNLTAKAAVGNAGGSITSVSLLGSSLIVTAGNGSDGLTGGAGGSIGNVALQQQGTVFIHSLVADAGSGGSGTTGNGGAGGTVNGLTSVDGDFIDLRINSAGGRGGSSNARVGGAGGVVVNVNLFESNGQRDRADIDPLFGNFVLRSGTGGTGKLAGGAGGALGNITFEGENMNVTVVAADGGSSSAGNGGAGGLIRGLQVNVDGNVLNSVSTAATATVVSGVGGDGAVNGGAGGSVSGAIVRVFDDLAIAANNPPMAGGTSSLQAGAGGNGDTLHGGLRGAPGAGGSISVSGVYAEVGSGIMTAGNAGQNGASPAAGGSIAGTSASGLSGLYASKGLTIAAGNGSQGGAGGNLIYVGYGAPTEDLLPVPTGSIGVRAGDGSARHSTNGGRDYAGAGGSILNLYGTVSGTFGTTTVIQAGKGGEATLGKLAGAGGSISGLNLERGPQAGIAGGVLTIAAGDAGEATVGVANTAVAVGATGGSVTNVVIRASIGQGTVLRSIAAGDGGPGTAQGGAGGSVNSVQVEDHDIGVRSGAAFGYNTMGGIFAGRGGDSITAKSGVAGNVLTVSANSISAIVAGKFLSGPRQGQFDLATTVAGIKLNTSVDLTPTLGTAYSDAFELSYHPALPVTTTSGSETFQRVPGGTGAAVQPAGGPSTFTLTYKGQTTLPLDANASTTEIQDALNMLPNSPSPAYFSVAPVSGDPTRFTVSHADASTAPLTGLGTETTAILHGNARPADVQKALNQLSTVTAPGYATFPGATVVSSDRASFEVTYNSTGAPGNITAERILTHRATETVVGDATHDSIQTLQLSGTGQFEIVVDLGNGQLAISDRLNAPATMPTAQPAPMDGSTTPQQVQDAINNLLGSSVTVTAGLTPNSYVIDWGTPGPAPVVQAREFADLQTTVVTPGGGGAAELQTVNFTPLHGVNDLTFTVQGTNDAAANTVIVPADHTTSTPPTAAQVEAKLNTLPAIIADGRVHVTLAANNTFTITYNIPGNAQVITAYETLPASITPLGLSQQTATTSTEVQPGDGTLPEVQHVVFDRPIDRFSLSFPGDASVKTPEFAYDASPADVETALDNLSTAPAGGVHVESDGNHGYNVTYGDTAPHNELHVNEISDQQQRISVSSQGTFTFTNSAGGAQSVVLSPTASAATVQTAINSVLPAGHMAVVTEVPGEQGVYTVRYATGVDDGNTLGVTDHLALLNSGVANGVETVKYVRQITFDPDTVASAGILGAIAHFNKLSSDVFAYIDANANGHFDVGDRPIDGLVAAKNLSQQTINATPQARLIVNSDVNSAAPGQYRPVDPIAPVPAFFDFRNDNILPSDQ